MQKVDYSGFDEAGLKRALDQAKYYVGFHTLLSERANLAVREIEAEMKRREYVPKPGDLFEIKGANDNVNEANRVTYFCYYTNNLQVQGHVVGRGDYVNSPISTDPYQRLVSLDVSIYKFAPVTSWSKP